MGPAERIEAGRRQVRAAFADVGAPEPPLVSCPCPECDQLEQQLAGLAWTDLDADLASRIESSLSLLDGHAVCALLPAMLLAGYDPDVDVDEFLTYALESAIERPERFDSLSPAQGRAVLDFLRHQVADCEERGDDIYIDDPRRAIERYWSRFA